SGFSLQGEEALFRGYLHESSYTVAGFSKGAIDAVEFALVTRTRIDRLQLISPAFFLDKDRAFKEKQLESFRKNRKLYLRQFLKNIAYPAKKDLTPYLAEEEEKEKSIKSTLSEQSPKSYANAEFCSAQGSRADKPRLDFLNVMALEEQLFCLLHYPWEREKLQALSSRGITLEVYLGGRDRIIDPVAVMAYFKPFATVYFIKKGGHILDG
ncbi:MAG: hypothetical protein DSZ05_01520, partial [Sulfurospirillum sp.]